MGRKQKGWELLKLSARDYFFGDKLKNKNSWIVSCLQVRLKPPHSKGDSSAVNVNLFLCVCCVWVCVCEYVKPINNNDIINSIKTKIIKIYLFKTTLLLSKKPAASTLSCIDKWLYLFDDFWSCVVLCSAVLCCTSFILFFSHVCIYSLPTSWKLLVLGPQKDFLKTLLGLNSSSSVFHVWICKNMFSNN